MSFVCFLDNDELFHPCTDISQFKEYEESLYSIFLKIYESGSLEYNGIEVRMKHFPPEYGPKSGFYHLTRENYEHTGSEDDRYPDFKRAERIEWPWVILEKCSANCVRLLIWENQRNRKNNILLFCPELDYLVVLGKRKGYLLLVTAYPVEYDHRRNHLMDEYEEYNKQRAAK